MVFIFSRTATHYTNNTMLKNKSDKKNITLYEILMLKLERRINPNYLYRMRQTETSNDNGI
jgi:hypothetical protein